MLPKRCCNKVGTLKISQSLIKVNNTIIIQALFQISLQTHNQIKLYMFNFRVYILGKKQFKAKIRVKQIVSQMLN